MTQQAEKQHKVPLEEQLKRKEKLEKKGKKYTRKLKHRHQAAW